MDKYVIIVAGGSGLRMGGSTPKQFSLINGIPVLMHTFHAFSSAYNDFQFVLVLPKGSIALWRDLCKSHNFNTSHKIVIGGYSRFESVKSGLLNIEGEGLVFIHDGVRPLVSADIIKRCYNTAMEKGSAVPVIPVTDSVREIVEGGSRAVDRDRFYLIQTPQVFQLSLIKEAYMNTVSEDFTDDATLYESFGHELHLTEGERTNIKITWPSDLLFAESLIRRRV